MSKGRILIVIVVGLLMLPVFAPAVRADTTVPPTDDTYVDLNDPGTNKDSGRLRADYSNLPSWVITRRTYLRFNVDSATGTLTDARVRLYTLQAPLLTQNGVLAIWSTGDDWNGGDVGNGDETTLIWNNAPAPAASLDTTPAATANGTWIEFTSPALSAYINSQLAENGGDDIASFVVQWESCAPCGQFDSTSFENREGTGGTTNYPELTLYGPTDCDLASFTAAALPGAVDVRWETVSETDIQGFDLYRADDPQGDPVRLNDALIPAKQPGNPIGDQYQFVDRPAQPGTTYYYWLDCVFFDGSTARHGPVSAAAGPYRFYLPLVFK